MKPLMIYVAGPYSAPSREGVQRNVNKAIDAGIEIFSRGHFPYVPHLTDLVDLRAKEIGRDLSWREFIEWDSPWLKACDAILYLGQSPGADIELEEAKSQGKPIFYSALDIPRQDDSEIETESHQ